LPQKNGDPNEKSPFLRFLPSFAAKLLPCAPRLAFFNPQSAIHNGGNGGSGGARTRYESLNSKGLGGVPSQGASQKPVTLGHDLAQVVAAWDKLSAPLKAAILAIIGSATEKEVQ
jgi:hypothetical protein